MIALRADFWHYMMMEKNRGKGKELHKDFLVSMTNLFN